MLTPRKTRAVGRVPVAAEAEGDQGGDGRWGAPRGDDAPADGPGDAGLEACRASTPPIDAEQPTSVTLVLRTNTLLRCIKSSGRMSESGLVSYNWWCASI
jgi:hypothetical protein